MRRWPDRLPGQKGAALLWTVMSDPNRVTLSDTAAALCGTPRPLGRTTIAPSRAQGLPLSGVLQRHPGVSLLELLGRRRRMLGPRPEPPHAVSPCLGYVMVLEPGTGEFSIPTKPPGGQLRTFTGLFHRIQLPRFRPSPVTSVAHTSCRTPLKIFCRTRNIICADVRLEWPFLPPL